MTPTEVSVLTETLPGSRVGLTIEVPTPDVDAAYERVLGRLGRRVKVQGFRPGKAPRALIEARIGPETLREEVAEALVPQVLAKALEDHKIEPIDRPQVEIEEMGRGKPGRFKASVSVMPGVTLPDLASLSVEQEHTEVDDAMVEQRLDTLRDKLAEVEPVEREVRSGDIVVGDLRVFVGDEEVPDEAREAIELEVRDGVLVPELLAALPGTAIGAVATADVTMPEDHRSPTLAGKAARLEVTVQGLKEKRVPELTDEIAPQLSDGEHTTAAALRDAVREDLVSSSERGDQLRFEQKAVEAVVEAAEVELPDALVDQEVDRQVQRLDQQLQRQGMRLDRYLQYMGRTEQAYRADIRPEALGRVKTDLVLDELAGTLEIDPSDDEVKDYIRHEAEHEQELKDELDQFLGSDVALRYFRQRLVRSRTIDTVVERLGGVPVSHDHDHEHNHNQGA
jgi:trigger factor